MRFLEGFFLWAGIGFYMLSFLLLVWRNIFKQERGVIVSWVVFLAAFISHAMTILVRWFESGHPPVLWTYEHALLSSWFVSLIFIAAVRMAPSTKWLDAVVSLAVLTILGYGIMGHGTAIEPLPPPYQSNWLWVHVTFAWFAYGSFAVSFALAVLHLLKKRVREGDFFKRFPDCETLDGLTFKVITFGFVALAVEMGAGAIWAYGLWGRYWAWDPMETWTLISWLIYGLYIHLRANMGWRGGKAAWLAIIAFISIFIAFGGIAFMMGLHQTLI